MHISNTHLYLVDHDPTGSFSTIVTFSALSHTVHGVSLTFAFICRPPEKKAGKHDLSKWSYAELRDTINTSCGQYDLKLSHFHYLLRDIFPISISMTFVIVLDKLSRQLSLNICCNVSSY